MPKKSDTHSYEQVHQLKCLSSKKHSHIPLFWFPRVWVHRLAWANKM